MEALRTLAEGFASRSSKIHQPADASKSPAPPVAALLTAAATAAAAEPPKNVVLPATVLTMETLVGADSGSGLEMILASGRLAVPILAAAGRRAWSAAQRASASAHRSCCLHGVEEAVAAGADHRTLQLERLPTLPEWPGAMSGRADLATLENAADWQSVRFTVSEEVSGLLLEKEPEREPPRALSAPRGFAQIVVKSEAAAGLPTNLGQQLLAAKCDSGVWLRPAANQQQDETGERTWWRRAWRIAEGRLAMGSPAARVWALLSLAAVASEAEKATADLALGAVIACAGDATDLVRRTASQLLQQLGQPAQDGEGAEPATPEKVLGSMVVVNVPYSSKSGCCAAARAANALAARQAAEQVAGGGAQQAARQAVGGDGDADMRVCVITDGSRGDVEPLLMLGEKLKSRGCKVQALVRANYVNHCKSRGLDAVPVFPDLSFVWKDGISDATIVQVHMKKEHEWRCRNPGVLQEPISVLGKFKPDAVLCNVYAAVYIAYLYEDRTGVPAIQVNCGGLKFGLSNPPGTLAFQKLPSRPTFVTTSRLLEENVPLAGMNNLHQYGAWINEDKEQETEQVDEAEAAVGAPTAAAAPPLSREPSVPALLLGAEPEHEAPTPVAQPPDLERVTAPPSATPAESSGHPQAEAAAQSGREPVAAPPPGAELEAAAPLSPKPSADAAAATATAAADGQAPPSPAPIADAAAGGAPPADAPSAYKARSVRDLVAAIEKSCGPGSHAKGAQAKASLGLGLKAAAAKNLEALVSFLADGPPPAAVGWGSLVPKNVPPAALLLKAVMAAREAGRRLVVIGGMAKLHLFGQKLAKGRCDDLLRELRFGGNADEEKKALEDAEQRVALEDFARTQCCFVDSAPNIWLFARCCCVVHHGGAGTTHTCLYAGTPCIITPIAFDQPHWGARVEKLRVGRFLKEGPAMVAVAALAEAIREAVRLQEPAAELGRRMRAEPGVAAAAEAVVTFLKNENQTLNKRWRRRWRAIRGSK